MPIHHLYFELWTPLIELWSWHQNVSGFISNKHFFNYPRSKPFSDWWTSSRILKPVQQLTGGQCKASHPGVKCSHLFALVRTKLQHYEAVLMESSQKTIPIIKSTEDKSTDKLLLVCLEHATLQSGYVFQPVKGFSAWFNMTAESQIRINRSSVFQDCWCKGVLFSCELRSPCERSAKTLSIFLLVVSALYYQAVELFNWSPRTLMCACVDKIFWLVRSELNW